MFVKSVLDSSFNLFVLVVLALLLLLNGYGFIRIVHLEKEVFMLKSLEEPISLVRKQRSPYSFDNELERPRLGRIKPLAAAHFSADSSNYSLEQHHNYRGNGHLSHLQETFLDWRAEEWVQSLGFDRHFQLHSGEVSVQEKGLYFVYAQIFYHDRHDLNSFKVVHNNDQVLFQCTTSARVEGHKPNTCFTAGVVHLDASDRVSLKDFYIGRYTLFSPGKSFFGLIKLS